MRIVVLADDFSGAAEVAGAAFDRGLTAEVQTDFESSSTATVVAVDTNTRSESSDEAYRRVSSVARAMSTSKPEWVFKKVDSVLRGPVLQELEAIMTIGGYRRALLAPANPSRGRVVREGTYFIHGRQLSDTEFAADPEHPASSARVLDLVGNDAELAIHSVRIHEPIPTDGVSVVDALGPADLVRWAAGVDALTLAAGAADFFDAFLTAKLERSFFLGGQTERNHPGDSNRAQDDSMISTQARGASCGQWQTRSCPQRSMSTLFVCGSAAAWEGSRRRESRLRGVPVVLMPKELFEQDDSESSINRWADQVAEALETSDEVMAAIGHVDAKTPCPTAQLVLRAARMVHLLLQRRQVRRLCVEGGATASSLVRQLNWRHMKVCHSFGPGIVALRSESTPAPDLIVKPGSYPWPNELWPVNEST